MLFLRLVILAIFITPMVGAHTAYADACDDQVMTVMEESAWRSAKRDIEMAERIILHSDSVLEYSCLTGDFSGAQVAPWQVTQDVPVDLDLEGVETDRSSQEVAQERDQVMDEMIQIQMDMANMARTHNADGAIANEETITMDERAEIIASRLPQILWYNKTSPQAEYRAMYARYKELDKRYQDLLAEYSVARSQELEEEYNNLNQAVQEDGQPYNPEAKLYAVNVINEHAQNNFYGAFGGGTLQQGGVCATMQVVWNSLKCRDFEEQNFMSFGDMQAIDPRNLHTACAEPNRSQKWNEANTFAEPMPFNDGGIDQVVTYLSAITWNKRESCDDVVPIQTGVRAVPSDGQPYAESICPLPGCYYDPEDEVCKVE